MATEYHVQTPKAIHLGTVSCEDGFARYFCKNDTFILRYIAFYWLFGILKNFRRFFHSVLPFYVFFIVFHIPVVTELIALHTELATLWIADDTVLKTD